MAKRGRKRKAHEPVAAAATGPAAAASAAAVAVEADPAASPADEPSREPAAAPDATRARPVALAFIGLFLLFQIAMPLTYYLGGRGPDERFSWRMFSSVRMQKCSVRVDETAAGEERAVDLDREVQVAWVGMLERYRPAVVEKLLQRRCERAQASEVRFVRRCVETDGSKAPVLTVALDCQAGEFKRSEEPAR
jgi:hypothetical protein